MVGDLTRYLAYFLRRDRAGWEQTYLSAAHDRCLSCDLPLTGEPLYVQHRICPSCRFHYSVSARERVLGLADPASFREYYRTLISLDPITFSRHGYRARLRAAQRRTGLSDAALVGVGRIGGAQATLLVLDFGFLGGSMGSVVGEKVALAFELAADRDLPLVAVISGGGVRIQEGVLSLMQMAKTTEAATILKERKLPFVAVLANPATGQAYASFVNLADVILAEPGAMIGIAPFRTFQDATSEPIPHDAHTAEFHLRSGLLDQVVDREQLGPTLSRLLDALQAHKGPTRKASPKARGAEQPAQGEGDAESEAPARPVRTTGEVALLARHPRRPDARELIPRLVMNFVELHGDRVHGDDPTVVGGLGVLAGTSVVLIGHQRVRGTGGVYVQTQPQGFRKAQRLVSFAARFGLPVVAIVDTPGAYVGLRAEEYGIGNAVSSLMALMAQAPVPIISAISGEATSESALAFSLADRVVMLENAIYAPISPELAAARLHRLRASQEASEVTEALRLTAADSLALGIIDEIVPEPAEGAHTDVDAAASTLREVLARGLGDLTRVSPEKLVRQRAKRYRRMGEHSKYFREAVKNEWSQLLRLLRSRRRLRAEEAEPEEPQDAAQEGPPSAVR